MRLTFSVGMILVAAAQDTTLLPDDIVTTLLNDVTSSTAASLSSVSTVSDVGNTSTSAPVSSDQCVVGLEKAGTYTCGAICKSFDTTSSGTCPGNPKWSQADISGSCGATVDQPCSILVSKKQDPNSATCGKCYAMTKKVDTTSRTVFGKVISVDVVNEAAAKFQLPSAVFHTACPVICNDGGCALVKEECAAKGGAGIFDDCVVYTADKKPSIENFDIKLVDCDAGTASGTKSALALSMASIAIVHQLAI